MSEPLETPKTSGTSWTNAAFIAALFGAWIVLQIWVFPRSASRP